MKISKSDALSVAFSRPELRFEQQDLTSFSGLVLFQCLFARLGLYRRLARCFRLSVICPIYPHARIILLLITHTLLGFRCLRDSQYYADDPLVLRITGLKRMPSVSTISRQLSSMDEVAVKKLESLRSELVLDRLALLDSARITLDFDGTVLGTKRHAEGTAIGFNKAKKGQRSYYPLYCTVAQTGQVLDVLHRSGNVHDSNGAEAFVLRCIDAVRSVRQHERTVIEVRMDSAFFSDQMLSALEKANVRYTISVPFARFTSLKDKIEQRMDWQLIDCSVDRYCDAFEEHWRADSWSVDNGRRFLFVRQFNAKQRKGPLQLDLFEPVDYDFDFKVIITNRKDALAKAVVCHEGRGSQEGIFAELKSENALAYVPTKTWLGNRAFMSAVLIAHNLTRELEMLSKEPTRHSQDAKRAPLWVFSRTDSLRKGILQLAGRLIRPKGKLTLSMAINPALKSRFETVLHSIEAAA